MTKITIKCCIRKEMEKGDGTAREIHQRVTADLAVRKQMKSKEISLQTVATTLHTGDVKRNPRGWCTSSGGRPLRYSLTETANVSTQASATTPDVLERPMVALPPGSPTLANLLPSLVTFFGALNMCTQIVDPDSGEKYGTAGMLPHVIAAALPTDLMHFAARARLSDSVWPLPVRTIGCVAVPAITDENLGDALLNGVCARFWAHEGYVAAAHISAGPAFRRMLAEIATFLKIGVIQIGHDAEKTRIIHPAQGVALDSSLGITFPRLSA